MKRITLLLLAALVSIGALCQPVTVVSSGTVTADTKRGMSSLNLFIPRYLDTTAANLQKGIDSSGAQIYTYDVQGFWIRQHSPKKWVKITTGTSGFLNNIVLNGGTGTRLGYWVDGETIPVAGLTLDQAFVVITQRAIAPTYFPAMTGISSSPTATQYEYGYNLGTITLSSGFFQNDAGSLNATTYYQNGSPLGGNTTTISSLTSTQSFYVNKAYNQGPCKNNNLGTPDCTGRINAGSVNSSTISFTTGYRRIKGWLSDTTDITTGGQNTAILALSDNTAFSTSKVFSLNTGNPTGNQFYILGYVSISGTLNNLTKNGFPALDAYNTAVLSTYTNAQGATVSIRIYYDKVAQVTASDLVTN